MTKLFCETCNEEQDTVFVDGYDFGDKLMEGVKFKVKFIDGKAKCIGVEEDSEPYMKQFDWEHWKKRCEEFAQDYDVFICVKCGDDVYDEDQLADDEPKQGIKVELVNPLNVFNGLQGDKIK
jgi:hypothetical protein